MENISSLSFDYVLLATVDSVVAERIKSRFADLGISRDKMLTITIDQEKDELLTRFLDTDAICSEEEKKKRGVLSHD